jgi:hypothetical protein
MTGAAAPDDQLELIRSWGEHTFSWGRLSWRSWYRSIPGRCMSPFPDSNNIRLLWFPTSSILVLLQMQANSPQVHSITRPSQDQLDIILIITIALIFHILFFNRPIFWGLLNYRRGWVNTICRQRPARQLHFELGWSFAHAAIAADKPDAAAGAAAAVAAANDIRTCMRKSREKGRTRRHYIWFTVRFYFHRFCCSRLWWWR